MNLYLISQSVNNDCDTYDSCIVAATTEKEAALIRPDSRTWESDSWYSSWVKSPSQVEVKLIGVAVDGTAQGIILASFNAG